MTNQVFCVFASKDDSDFYLQFVLLHTCCSLEKAMEIIRERNACDQNKYERDNHILNKPLITSCYGDLSQENDYTYVRSKN